MLPNFLIVGAAKAGTTTTTALLQRHPEVFMADSKEPRFFTQNWHRGLQWYRQLFEGAEDHTAVGEASVAYTNAPRRSEAPRRIAESLGEIKYIYLVRHPIERMISHYKHALVHRWIPKETTFAEALELEPQIKHCSRYHYQFQQYKPFTRPDQWHIVVFERLVEDPQTVANEIFDFLGVRPLETVDVPHENQSERKSPVPSFLPYLRSVKSYLPYALIEHGRHVTGALIAASNWFGSSISDPKIPDALRSELEEDLAPGVDKLSQFCGKDLRSIWQLPATRENRSTDSAS